MTTERGRATSKSKGRRRKRPHPAATARTVAAGAATAGTCALVAVFGLTAPAGQVAPGVPRSGVANVTGTTAGPSTAAIDELSTAGLPSDQNQFYARKPSLGTAGQTEPVTRSSSS